jgi:16S rRNA (uracil1498-N3)-methyltransferase
MQLFYCPGLQENIGFLNEEESRHCSKVLRKKSGDIIDITDGSGNFYEAEIIEPHPKKSSFTVLKTIPVSKPDHHIHIAVSPTKNADRMEWFIEKAVEIGIDKGTFILTENSERTTVNLDRIKKKAISAMKQSVRAFLPEISGTEKFMPFIKNNQVEQKYIAHLEKNETPFLEKTARASGDYLVLIGPEGGFTNEEVAKAAKQHYKIVKIGNYRLRTETAAVVTCTLLNQLNH